MQVTVGDHEIPARVADSLLSKTRGHMFRTQTPDYALVFPFSDVDQRKLHMWFVPFPLEALFCIDGTVRHKLSLRQWIGMATAPADMVIELPAGEYDVQRGDRVELLSPRARRASA